MGKNPITVEYVSRNTKLFSVNVLFTNTRCTYKMAILCGLKMTVISQLCNISRHARGVEMAKEHHMYTEMLSLLDRYEEDIYSDWCNGLEQACLMNLNQPLLSRDTSSDLISLNFNPKVV